LNEPLDVSKLSLGVRDEPDAIFAMSHRAKNVDTPRFVGTIDGSGFSVGIAPSQDRPMTSLTHLAPSYPAWESIARVDSPPVPTKDQLFEIFKSRDGNTLAGELLAVKRQINELIGQKQGLVSEINAAQKVIERLAGVIEAKNLRSRPEIFEDEAKLLKKEQTAKHSYRQLFQTLQQTQTEIDLLKEKCGQARLALLSGFEEWFTKWTNNELFTEKVIPLRAEPDAAPTVNPKGKESLKPRATKAPPRRK
jgi:hypothetical protein